MGIDHILSLVAGLALFLLGMNSMGSGLENACGNKMKTILEKLTSNRFLGVIVGALITMVIQSSSATTVMVVGFVNAGMMTLSQAVWIIMGANIGTTITGQLIALDIGFIAPIFAIIGVIMIVFLKKPTLNEIGKILCGFGVLFIGMDMMSSSMTPLRDMPEFVSLMTKFSNPLLGILAGIIFTAVIQSSSASVGILQALAISGAIGLDSAVFVLFGQNIGTCVTALLASAGTNRNAKRTTLIHFMFNLIGTILFSTLCVATPLTDLVKTISGDNPSQQIANMHTLFNIATTIILLPLGSYLVKLANIILPDKVLPNESVFQYLGHDLNMRVGGTAIHLENTRLEIKRLYEIAKENINKSIDLLLGEKINTAEILEKEDFVDKLNEGITKEITECISHESNHAVSEAYSSYLNISHDIERLSDHAVNLMEYALEFNEKNITLNEVVKEEISNYKDIINQMLSKSMDGSLLKEVEKLEDITDNMTIEYKQNMVKRLTNQICTAEGSIIYSNVLINFERLGDHLLNIAQSSALIK